MPTVQAVVTAIISYYFLNTVKPVYKTETLKRPKIGFQDQLSLNAGQVYFRIFLGYANISNIVLGMHKLPIFLLQGENSTILSTFLKIPFVIKIFVLSFLSGHLYTGLTVPLILYLCGYALLDNYSLGAVSWLCGGVVGINFSQEWRTMTQLPLVGF